MAVLSVRYIRRGAPRRAMLLASLLAACTGDNSGPAKPVASVDVTPLSAPLPVGTTLQLTAVPKDAQGDKLSGRSVTWSSSDTTVARVNSTGIATGVSLGSVVMTATVEGMSGTASLSVTPGSGAQLVFTAQPTSLVAGVIISPPIVVTALDVGGNVATGFTGTVTAGFGSNPGGGTLLGTTTLAAVGGVATFSDLHIDRSGSGYTLTASSGALTTGTSAALIISPAQATKLIFSVQPQAAAAGVSMTPAVQVAASDQFGNGVPSFTDSVTVAIGTNPGGGTLSGTKRVAAASGVATFTDLSIDHTGTGYTLTATTATLSSGTSTGFAVAPGPVSASQSTVAVSPATITSSSGSSAATITVTARDAFGNPIPGLPVVLASTGSGNTLAQPAAQTNSAGVATGTLSSTVSEVKTVSATAGGVAVTETASVTVNPAAAGILGFTVQPSTTGAGASITPAVVVSAKDAFGNLSTSFTGTVTVAIGGNPSGGALSGTLGQAAVAGVATFNDLHIDKSGVGYSLTAAATGMTGATSAPFTVSAGPPSAAQSTVAVSPAAITASTGPGAATVTVTARDAGGNLISGAAVVLGATGLGNTLTQPAAVTGAGGTATGTLSSSTAETKTITATINGTAITQQATLTVNAAAASAAQSTIGAIPTSMAASSGGVISTITVTAKDAFGNLVPGATVALSAPGAGNTVTQPTSSTNGSGVATGSLSSTLVGQKVVSATVNGSAIPGTATITVVPGDVSVTLSSLLAALPMITAGTGPGVDTITVTAKDNQGNVIPGASVVLSATGSANVIGQPTVTDANGVAKGTFRSSTAEAKIISATIAGSGIDPTDTITVVPSAPVALAFAVQPTSTIIGKVMSPPVQVEIRDAYANRVTTATNSIALGFGANPGGATLSGGGSAAAVGGVVTFSALSVSAAGTGYTLAASSSGLTGAVSGTFNVSAGVVSAAQSTVSVSPASIVAGSATSTVTITAKDASGTLLPGVTVALSATGNGNTIVQPTGLTNGSGVTTGSLSSTVSGSKTVTATANGVTITQQPTITVTAGAISASQSTVEAIPSAIVVSTGTSSIQVTAKDQFGNPVSGATVTLNATGTGVTLTQPSAATNAAGVATGSVKATSTGTVTVSGTAGGVPLTQTAAVTVTVAGASVVFIGAGDIADCRNNNDAATAALLQAIPNVPVFTLGDNAYPAGTTVDYQTCYDPTWGAFKSRTHPSVGNREYDSSATAAPYFAYFGAAAGTAGQGYYSFDLGSWHIIVLNSNISTSAGSPQEVWLKADLAAHPATCTLAYWHHPLYSSVDGVPGTSGAVITSARPFWNDLYAAGAELVLNGHRHDYERLAPMAPDGTPDSLKGIRTIIAGTGGQSGGNFTNIFPTSEVRNGTTYGILKLTLSTGSYSWQFIGVPGSTFTDSGTNVCH